jgi:uncharacterized protein YjbI with pentapeptide repeats
MTNIPANTSVYQKISIGQLNDAYRTGQRDFYFLEIIGKEEYPVVANLDFRDAMFYGCRFDSVTFDQIDFSHARFWDCNLRFAFFKSCNLSGSIWETCAWEYVSVVDSDMKGIRVLDQSENYKAETIDRTVSFIEYVLNNGRSALNNPP